MTEFPGGKPAKPATETLLTHMGRAPAQQFGFVNTPAYRGSTVVFPTLDALDDYSIAYRYGRQGSPTTRGIEEMISELEGAAGTLLAPSGLAAITLALLAVVSAGDDILVTDSVYEPTRAFCDGLLARLGVTTRYYDPRIGAGIESLFTDRTRAVFVESPGSHTFEMQDLPAIATVAKARGAAVIVDNSWATPLFHRPLALGADLVVHAGTKMFVGHSDAMSGTVSATAQFWPALAKAHRQLGVAVGPDDAFLVARGMRTLAIRMKEHEQRALALADWLTDRPGVIRVIHPARPDHPDHAIYRRDFSGSGSLFGVVLEEGPREAIAAFVDGLELFSMGYSWGGYESLILPSKVAHVRTATRFEPGGTLFRIHVGFEALDDLKADLSAGLARYRERL
ncbi:cystathionine beta-lyase [Devosia enhydra]|uniref:Cystathionine beta-lyase n=1 Tax=Devosia enhydra TaxID=665118 RepID=A0A1K2HV14_9HYPH|nr:cystathionine beta-lyase [Devosia enhydra]SFZ82488.1 cystathionine beta-lyase [Devosia enhydra]